MFLNNMESPEEQIDKSNEDESDDEISCSSHNSEKEFEQNDEDSENSDSEKSAFVSKNHTVWQKEKSNEKVKT